MKLSISNIAWKKEDDNEMYSFLKSNGYDGLEIAPTRILPENPYSYLNDGKSFSKDLKSKYGLNIPSMQSILYGRQEKLFSTEEDRNLLISYLKKAIDFASVIGCENLVFGSPKNRVITDSEQYSIAVDFFRTLGEYAVSRGTVISIEPNPEIYGTNFITKTSEAFSLVDEVSSEGFKINMDLGTVIQNSEKLDSILDNLDKVNHIHISEPYLALVNKRSMHRYLAGLLKDANYSKYVSIEMGCQDNLDDVKKAVTYVKEVFHGN